MSSLSGVVPLMRQAVQYDKVTGTFVHYYVNQGAASPVVGHGRPLAQISTLTDSSANVRLGDGGKVGRIGGVQ